MVDQEQHALCLLESLKRMYEEEECFLSDVTLLVGGEPILAHKLVLAAQSDFFKGLFRNDPKREVNIEICSPVTLRTIVTYFYTGRSDITTENVQDILVAANFLQVKELIVKCSDFMARNLDLLNCVTVLRLADLLNNETLLQESVNYIGDNFQYLFHNNPDLRQLPVELFAKCIKSDRIILFSRYGTVLPAIQREEALVRVIVEYVRSHDQDKRIKDTWPLFRALKLPFIAHHLDFRELGLPELANFDDDPTVHSLIRSSRVQKEDDLRRKYSVDPFSKHNSKLRAYSIKYVIWSERFASGPNLSYREIRPFSCEGGTDKFIRSIDLLFRPWENKHILGGMKVVWSNGSTDVAGVTETDTEQQTDIEKYTVNLEEGENIQKLDLRCGWFIDRLQLTSNKGRLFGPFGGDGGDSRRTQRLLRRNVDPKFVYLDGIRGYVVQTEGKPALNRLSFKWSFFLDRKISKYSYYNSLVIKEDNEKISVAELETEINLTLSDDKHGRKRIFPTPMVLVRPQDEVSEEEDEFGILGMELEGEDNDVLIYNQDILEDQQDLDLPFLY